MPSSRSIAPQVTQAERPAAPTVAAASLKASLTDRLQDMSTRAAEIICTEVPTYAEASDALFDDVRAHVISHLSAIVDRFGTARTISREELLFIRAHAARRVGRIPIADFVNAFYIGERVLWETALSLAHDDASRRAALEFATHLPRYFEVATTHAAEVYLEAEEQLAATGERIRRDLLEDLIAGVPLAAGPRLDAARAAGLTPSVDCVVICATPAEPCEDEHMLRGGGGVAGPRRRHRGHAIDGPAPRRLIGPNRARAVDRPWRLFRDLATDHPQQPDPRGRRDHALLRRQHARRGADRLDLRADQRDHAVVVQLAHVGVHRAVAENAGPKLGVNVAGGQVTYAPVAETFGIPHADAAWDGRPWWAGLGVARGRWVGW
jgi:hypothetical protein